MSSNLRHRIRICTTVGVALLEILTAYPAHANPFVILPKVAVSLHYLHSQDIAERRKGAQELWEAVGVFHHAREVRQYPGIVRKLVRLLEKETDRNIQISLLLTLAYMKSQRGVPTLTKLTRSAADRGVRQEALRGLVILQKTQAIPLLKEAFSKDRDIVVRFEAAKLLGELGDESGLSFALHELQSDDPWRAGSAVDILGAIGSPVAVPALNKLLENPTKEIFGIPRRALLDIEFKQKSSEIERKDFLWDKLYGGQMSAAWAAEKLARLKTHESVMMLLKAAGEKGSYGGPKYWAASAAKPIFEGLYWDATQMTGLEIERMIKTGHLTREPPD